MLTPIPSGVEYENYDKWWEWVIKNFENLLSISGGLFSGENSKLVISKMLIQARGEYAANMESSVIDLAELKSFLEELDSLKDLNQFIFDNYRKQLTSKGKGVQFYHLTGMWFEIRVTNYLLSSGFSFESPEPPDFLVKISNSKISVECYVPIFDATDNLYGKFYRKLNDKVKKYRKHEWVRGNSLLFVDITWLVTKELKTSGIELSLEFYDVISKIDLGDFNHLVCFWFGHGKGDDSRIVRSVRSPNKIYNPEIKFFLDNLLSDFKEDDSTRIIIPDLPEIRSN